MQTRLQGNMKAVCQEVILQVVVVSGMLLVKSFRINIFLGKWEDAWSPGPSTVKFAMLLAGLHYHLGRVPDHPQFPQNTAVDSCKMENSQQTSQTTKCTTWKQIASSCCRTPNSHCGFDDKDVKGMKKTKTYYFPKEIHTYSVYAPNCEKHQSAQSSQWYCDTIRSTGTRRHWPIEHTQSRTQWPSILPVRRQVEGFFRWRQGTLSSAFSVFHDNFNFLWSADLIRADGTCFHKAFLTHLHILFLSNMLLFGWHRLTELQFKHL